MNPHFQTPSLWHFLDYVIVLPGKQILPPEEEALPYRTLLFEFTFRSNSGPFSECENQVWEHWMPLSFLPLLRTTGQAQVVWLLTADA